MKPNILKIATPSLPNGYDGRSWFELEAITLNTPPQTQTAYGPLAQLVRAPDS